MIRPWCFNRAPRTGMWVRAGWKRTANGIKPHWRWVSHRMSQECRAWSTGDRATPAPALDGWACAGCEWLPEEARKWIGP